MDDVLADVEPVDSREHARSALAGAGRHGDRRKGRGVRVPEESDDRYAGKGGVFESLDAEGPGGPQRCAFLE